MGPTGDTAPHRIGPAPTSQLWRDAVFLHWPCDPDRLAPLLPPGTRPDVFAGTGWLGVVALRMPVIRLAGVPLGGMTQLNVRTYCVDRTGAHGQVFLAMELSRPELGAGLRVLSGLPCRGSRVRQQRDGGTLGYRAERRGLRVRFLVRPGEAVEPGPLERFLTARWALHFARAGRTVRLPVAHEPWRLRSAELLGLSHRGLAPLFAGCATGPRWPHVLVGAGVSARFGFPALLPPRRP